jgi:hypothetical protein
MAAANGNLDDIFAFTAMEHHDEFGMTEEEAKKFGPAGFRKLVKGLLWRGDQAAADKFDPEAIIHQMAEKTGINSNLYQALHKFETGEEMNQPEKEALDDARIKAREQATKNAVSAGEEDKDRLLSIANLSSAVIKSGHWEQEMGTFDPATESARFMDIQEQIEDVSGEAQKMGMRPFLSSFAPHNIRSRIWDEKTRSYKVSYKKEDMEAYQRALWGPDGPFKPQQAGEMRQMQTRIMEQFIGGYFDDKGEVLQDVGEIREKFNIKGGSDEDAKKAFVKEFAAFREMNPEIFDALWQTKYLGGRPATGSGTTYSQAWSGVEAEKRGKISEKPSGKFLAENGYIVSERTQEPSYKEAVESETEPAAARAKPVEAVPAKISSYANWKNLDKGQQSEFIKTAKLQKPDLTDKKEIEKEARNIAYQRYENDRRIKQNVNLGSRVKEMSQTGPAEIIKTAPANLEVDINNIERSGANFNSQDIVAAIDGLKLVMDSINNAIISLKTDSNIQDYSKFASQLDHLKNSAGSGQKVEIRDMVTLLHSINENLKDRSKEVTTNESTRKVNNK